MTKHDCCSDVKEANGAYDLAVIGAARTSSRPKAPTASRPRRLRSKRALQSMSLLTPSFRISQPLRV
jgi:hypothetical protein